MKKLLILSTLLFLPLLALADNGGGTFGSAPNTLGVAASNINEIIAFIYNIIDVILYIIATILGMSSVMKFRLHRRNPQQVPLSTPVTELTIALVFIAIAVAVQLSGSYKTVADPNTPPAYIAPGAAPASRNAYPSSAYPQ
ncbi:MAG TPA: hypothetical protein VI522_05340 [Gammaproteobacteria bacterium]|nr:hypothetical protein [Gammaproteobacteria bacterium]